MGGKRPFRGKGGNQSSTDFLCCGCLTPSRKRRAACSHDAKTDCRQTSRFLILVGNPLRRRHRTAAIAQCQRRGLSVRSFEYEFDLRIVFGDEAHFALIEQAG